MDCVLTYSSPPTRSFQMTLPASQDANNIPLPAASEIETPPVAPAVGREQFIPLRKADLLRLLMEQPTLTSTEREQFSQLCRLLEATFHYEYHQRWEELKNAYAPFDPDADTLPGEVLDENRRNVCAHELFDRFIKLLQRCDFQRLSREEIEAASHTVTEWGVNLEIDFDVFDQLEVFVRGDVIGRRSRRRLRKWYRLEEVEVPTYQRLVLIFRLADHEAMENAAYDAVYIKIFKNIHKADLEMLLPGTSVKMTLVDRTKIAFPTVSGLGVSAYKATQMGLLGKLLKGGVVAALAGGFWGIFAFAAVGATMIGYAVKSFFNYLTTKDKYQLNLTRSLYFQNLDNNAGVLARLIDEAEEQDCREAFLAWYLLWREAGPDGWPPETLGKRAEAYLENAVGIHVDFDYRDAVHKLRRLRLVEITPQGRLVAASIAHALHRLDHAWDNYFHHPEVPAPEDASLKTAS